ncbi:hypothetical protein BDV12DRAFT_175527 [Aspergillus spectabilis]
MPIVALPPTTVRAIGSRSIISDPCSLAKELLDNALDASASSVAVEISQNTVDLIQVKDNGHGIPVTGHALACRRAFTSKIHTLEDLRNVGGKSLGFRGEALASAAEVSGSLTISTRVDAEPVGSSLKYGRNGELISTERLAHPVGTTVRISDLFRLIPVRRQVAIKNSKKTLLKIRKMIQTYAMARPSTRLSLKVLKAKSESGNLMYAPGKHATLMEAALKIAGTEVASNCMVKEWPTPPSDSQDSKDEIGSTFRLTALLPKPGSDYTKFNNSGQYISIDGRPVSSGRGVAQAIVKVYKSYLRFVASRDGSAPTITDPFFCVHIGCPGGSYDANIEPSKDDILFEDQPAVLSLVEELFRDAYGERPEEDGARYDPIIQDTPPRNGFEVLLMRNSNGSTPHTPATVSGQGGFTSARSFVRLDPPSHQLPGARSSIGRRPGNSAFIGSNNVRSSDAPAVGDFQSLEQKSPKLVRGRLSLRGDRAFTGGSTTPARAQQANSFDSCLLSPVISMGSPPSDTAPRSPLFSRTSPSAVAPELSQLLPPTPVRNVRQQQREHDRERYGNGSLDTWFLRLPQAAQTRTATEVSQGQDNEPSLSQLAQDQFGSEEMSPNGLSGLTSSRSEPTDGTPNSSLRLESSQPSLHISPQTARAVNKPHGLPVLEQWSARLYNASNPDENPELRKALEFETRKKAAIQERRMQLKTSGASGPTNSRHQSRYLAARAALSSNPDSEILLRANPNGMFKPVLSPHDPRAYLMRAQHTQQTDAQGVSNIRRITSSKLPFEKIPEGHDLHRVALILSAEPSYLCTSYREISKNDLYTQSGDEIEAFTSPDINADIEIWSARLSHLTTMHYRTKEDEKIPVLQFDLSAINRMSAIDACDSATS